MSREDFIAAHRECRVAGTAPASVDEEIKVMRPDGPIDKPPKDCARCGKRFQPTMKRRAMCDRCYATATSSLEN